MLKHITKSDKSTLASKDLKNSDKLLKWCLLAGKQFHGFIIVSAKKLLHTSA